MRRFEILSEEERVDRYKALAKKALLAYGLAPDLTYIGQGSHIVFRAALGGGIFAVRIGDPGRDLGMLRRELLWLAALGRDTSLSVPEPLLTLRGDLFSSVSMEGVPGTRSCSVIRWIEGERREAELTPDEVSAMGSVVAALHRHAEGFRWPEEIAPSQGDAAGRAFAACDSLRSVFTLPGDPLLLTDAAALIADHTPESTDARPIHGDLRLRKLRLKERVAGIVGFGRCRAGTDLEDLSPLWAELGERRTATELQEALLDGYRSVRPLPFAPEAAFRAYGALRALEDAATSLDALRQDRRSKAEASERITGGLRRSLSNIVHPTGT
ncbi:MAG: phosphotransferase [Candidatus Bipolaricaulis sp.]|nr:phosphotransferase [Candidatus Bipolaricaulis sp.]